MMRDVLLAGLAALGLISCAAPGSAGGGKGMVTDALAPVIAQPPSPAYTRVQSLAASRPQMGEFIRASGMPDFVIESRKDASTVMVMYYLKTNKAWLCITEGKGGQAAILGPEPIAAKELNFLKAAKALQQ